MICTGVLRNRLIERNQIDEQFQPVGPFGFGVVGIQCIKLQLVHRRGAGILERTQEPQSRRLIGAGQRPAGFAALR